MTKDQLWAKYAAANPAFEVVGGNVTMTAKGLRKLFEQTWDIAESHGFDNGKAWQKNVDDNAMDAANESLKNGPYGDIFGEMFGGGKKK